jgi:hypothetical protein
MTIGNGNPGYIKDLETRFVQKQRILGYVCGKIISIGMMDKLYVEDLM